MSDYLTLTRAARLVGVNRAKLQQQIRRGEIATFEGKVSVSELLRLYPQATLSDDKELDRVTRIKATAAPSRQPPEVAWPAPEVLMARLRGISDLLTEKLAALEARETLLDQVADRLDRIIQNAPEPTAEGVRAVRAWLSASRAGTAGQANPATPSRLFANDTFLRIMAATVKIEPSGHEFFVEGQETILDAAVRAGLHIAYGCSSGNCGACKARVVSGEVFKVREHDYVLSEREKQLGYCLTCSNTPVTDLVLEAIEALSVADLPEQEIRASVRKTEHLTADLILLQIQTPRTQTLRFMAGQGVRLTLEDGAEARLPIASCPCNGRNLHFFVSRAPGHPFSDAVFAGLRHGQLVQIKGPIGHFVLDEETSDPAVFIAFGDGMAPIKSLIEHVVSIDLIESLHLYWVVTRPEEHHLGQWARALTDALDEFHYTPLVTDKVADLLVALRADLTDLTRQRYYIAGPATEVLAVRDALRAGGVAEEAIRVEVVAGLSAPFAGDG
ncbi:2Fe-2S iron-sulfur cluster-binding protein [Thioalkalicoccus limnaeus]|uniref:2Fe-2S iron-sulfur cluster-binding protein n=1 Tax=Thioalkalicoccus limnaeus TaxID=120681 RepID=A0ABV4BF59_9GAMM